MHTSLRFVLFNHFFFDLVFERGGSYSKARKPEKKFFLGNWLVVFD